jgi:hypothetical protein
MGSSYHLTAGRKPVRTCERNAPFHGRFPIGAQGGTSVRGNLAYGQRRRKVAKIGNGKGVKWSLVE